MTSTRIKSATHADTDGILALYRAVGAIEGGILRDADEVTPDFVCSFVREALAHGYCLVARASDGTITGEIHAWVFPGIRKLAHVLGELTIAVHPAHQGAGIGRALFKRLLDIVERERPDILRVELGTQASNARAIAFYESLGFVLEGRMEKRIAMSGGRYEADLLMGWVRK